ncbi:autotransporter assembly complex protein TamA [Aquimonas voraii]|uniref:autotransporter assembly complex protein TamA n=1 Tax=Aquimonas voraii TaxID=265719 RepID=UPI00115FD8C8|nr:autotransporter assembly complex family protein [Aquimonas voraii]
MKAADRAPLRLASVRVRGLSASQADNVRAQVGLFQLDEADREDVGPGRMALLLRRAPDEVRRALEPFGYYAVGVDVQVDETAAGLAVSLNVQRGPPVRVRTVDVRVEGAAAEDARIASAIAAFRPRVGDLMNHARYEGGKAAIARELSARGYFDARLEENRVEVIRADSRADIRLRWASGARYRFGTVAIDGSQLEPGLVERWIDIAPGQDFDQAELLQLHQRLGDLDYFGFIDLRPEPEPDTLDVPVQVELAPAKRDIYTAGLSFGTDSGAGLKLGLDRRWVNARGHKFSAGLDLAQRRSALNSLYRIPAFAPIEGWYQLGASYREDESELVDSETAELSASRIGRLGDWSLELGLHALRERYAIGVERNLETSGLSTLVYPALRARWQRYNDANYSTRGFSFTGEVKQGLSALGSDANFTQLLVQARYIRGFGERNRVLLRGQLGRTFSGEFLRLPSSLRFFAGGDRSVRGYGYQEISPSGLGGNPVGGRNLAVLNIEYERMFTEAWGAAVFADAGSAFNDGSIDLRRGAGLGLRWRSPVGQVALDLARGLDDPREPFQIHLSLGPEL